MHIIFKNANKIAKMENFFFSSSPIYVLNDVINSDKSFFVPKMWGKEDMCQKSIYFDKWKCLCGSKITYSMYTFKIVWSDWRTKLNFTHYLISYFVSAKSYLSELMTSLSILIGQLEKINFLIFAISLAFFRHRLN